MAFIKRNIWLAFHLFTVTWLALFIYTTYDTYRANHNDFATRQSSITTNVALSYSALLKQYEVVLNILSNEIFQDGEVPERRKVKNILKNVADVDDSMVGFAVLEPNGSLYTASNATLLPKQYNLLEIEETKKSFEQALKVDHAVFGRTYYSTAMRKLIMPAYLTVRDRYNQPVLVISASILIDKAFKFVEQDENEGTQISSYIFRDSDRYFQFAPIELRDEPEIYKSQLDQQAMQETVSSMESELALPINEIKASGKTFVHEKMLPKRQALTASIYIKRYAFWVSSEVKVKDIRAIFFQKMTQIIIVFVVSLLVIYALFRSIARNELNKQQALSYQANHDYLTRLNNRYFLDSFMPTLDSNAHYSMLFIDMDNFKAINDNYGHEIGDLVLCETAKRLLSATSEHDIVIRYSGDEFILVTFENKTEQLRALSNNILGLINQPYKIRDYRFILSASIGVANYPKDGDNSDEIKRYADLAMYESKRTRNTITFFEDRLKNEHLYATQIELELKHALMNHEFYMVYQPQVKPDGTLQGVEALIRWENPQLGFVPPDKFISIAEAIGVMPAIGRFVIARSLEQMMEIKERTGRDITLSVNISVTQFHHQRFFEDLMELTKSYQFDNLRLVLEVTENVFIEDVAGVQTLLRQIKSHGMRCSLDDFGTGYSSLSLLKQLPIDELKIDKSFVDDMLEDKAAYTMVEWIVTIAHKLGISTVAEGVETAEQQQALAQLNCDIFQGYHFSKPLTQKQLIDYIEQQSR
ncbi:putative bifunctional diguanylate cyclase/phosphodiesterase [Vibrio sp. M260118]|uniref:putative bifunctional diguanylate cyclase/phosphodiesterase n=1 Tax=Vibrio sp. M260118 TaxID=3020896 RepID=UPI002F4209E5